MAHIAKRAGETCTKRQTQNRNQKLALHSRPGTATGNRRNQAGCGSSPQSGHMDDRALIKRKIRQRESMTIRYKGSKSKGSRPSSDFTASELRTLRALKNPAGIQKFLDDLPYNLKYTARSPKKVLCDRVASCLEG